LTFQIGAEANQFSEYSLGSIKTNDLGRGEENSSNFDSLAQIKVLNSEQAQDAIRVIDKAIQEVNGSRGEMGAFQKNNLESNLNYLRIAHENSVSSESVIRDADMAEEMATFTRNQIMMEASTSMLAQSEFYDCAEVDWIDYYSSGHQVLICVCAHCTPVEMISALCYGSNTGFLPHCLLSNPSHHLYPNQQIQGFHQLVNSVV